MSQVTVKMNTCNKVHRIKVTAKDSENLNVSIDSNCKNVQEYAKKLTVLTMDDIINFTGSKVNLPEIRCSLSTPCLCPIGVIDAAWLEVGMLSKGLCAKIHSNEIILDPNDPSNVN